MYKRLFIDELQDGGVLKEFREFYRTHCLYKGSGRSGDSYLRELFKALVLCLYDKFGVVGFQPYYKILYAFVYKTRILKQRVTYKTVAKVPVEGYVKPFDIIAQARKPKEIEKMYEACKISPQDFNHAANSTATNVREIIEFFRTEFSSL